jgi:gamma-glutamylcyclotransferase (GGCT)/AIG2-like uncharacterized protein YtfP
LGHPSPRRRRIALVRRPGSEASGERTDLPLFAYGTLADAGFVARLLERPVAAEPAELLEFSRVEPEGFAYPVVFAEPGGRTPGLLYRSLRPEDWERLDAYEGVGEKLYFRDLAETVPPGGAPGTGEETWVYLPTDRTVRQFVR